MIHGNLNSALSWPIGLQGHILKTSTQWLLENAESLDEGKYELGAPGWFADIHSYRTREGEKCAWESHSYTLDFQYVISGSEIIKYSPPGLLKYPKKVDQTRDRTDWIPPQQKSSEICLYAGDFVIFLPGEPHCPMILTDEAQIIRKAVIKIPAHLLC